MIGKSRCEMHATVSGPADARHSIVFLHGFMGSSEDWSSVARVIGRDCRVIAVDLPDHGASIWPFIYGFDDVAEALNAVLDRYGAGKPVVVGYSMGGRIALYWALCHPERVRRLVLESASPGVEGDADRSARRRLDEERAAELEQGLFAAFLDRWYAQPLFASLQARPDLLQEVIARRMQNDPRSLARSLRALGAGVQPSLWDRLRQLDVPVELITGVQDEKYCALAQRMVSLLPRAAHHTAPGCGHTVHLESPEAFAEYVSACLV